MYFLFFISIFSLLPSMAYGMERAEYLNGFRILAADKVQISELKRVRSWLQHSPTRDEGEIDGSEQSMIEPDKKLRRKWTKNPLCIIDSSELCLKELFEHWSFQGENKKISILPQAKGALVDYVKRKAIEKLDNDETLKKLLLNYSMAFADEESRARGPLYCKEINYCGKTLYVFCAGSVWYLFEFKVLSHPDMNDVIRSSQQDKKAYCRPIWEDGIGSYLFASHKPKKNFVFQGGLAFINP